MLKDKPSYDKKLYFHKNGKLFSNKLEPVTELLFLTKGKCLMSFLEETNREQDPMTYHHLTRKTDGGPKTFENGAPLLYSYHGLLNAIHENDRETFEMINYSLDYIKEVIEMDELFKLLYSNEEIEKHLSYDKEEVLEDFFQISEEKTVQNYSLEQAVAIRKALLIYKEEVIPQIELLKEKYEEEGLLKSKR